MNRLNSILNKKVYYRFFTTPIYKTVTKTNPVGVGTTCWLTSNGIRLPPPSNDDLSVIPFIRNVGVFAHINAGKTTVTEGILYSTNEISLVGNIKDGTTTTDYLEQEKQRGITIRVASITCSWKNYRINLLDTPGHVDFSGDTRRVVAALDGGVIVIDGCRGVEAQTLSIWNDLRKSNLPRILFINKLDRPNASLCNAFSSIKTHLCCPRSFVIVSMVIACTTLNDSTAEKLDCRYINVNLITLEATHYYPSALQPHIYKSASTTIPLKQFKLPETMLLSIYHYRSNLLEILAEHDETFESLYLTQNEENLLPQDIHDALIRLTHLCKVYPVLSGIAKQTIGITDLLNGIINYLPNPSTVLHMTNENYLIKRQSLSPIYPSDNIKTLFHTLKTTTLLTHNEINNCLPSCLIKLKSSDPFSKWKIICQSNVSPSFFVFKVLPDNQNNVFVFVRVLSGILSQGQYYFNSRKGNWNKLSEIYKVKADSYIKTTNLIAGDIGMVRGFQFIFPGDTLISEFEEIPFQFDVGLLEQNFVCSASIEPVSVKYNAKLLRGLQNLGIEDPTIKFILDEQTQQYQIWGAGELHLQIIKDRLESDYGIEAYLGPLEIAYYETLITSLYQECLIDKENDDTGSFELKLTPQFLPDVCLLPKPMSNNGLTNKLFIQLIDQNWKAEFSNFILNIPILIPIVNNVPSINPKVEKILTPQLVQLIYETMISECSCGPLRGYPLVSLDIIVRILKYPTLNGLRQFTREYLHQLFRDILRPLQTNSISESKTALLEPMMCVKADIEHPEFKKLIIQTLIQESEAQILPDTQLDDTTATTQALSSSTRVPAIHAIIPLRNMKGIISKYRKITKGRGEIFMEFWGYQPVAPQKVFSD